jgi:hypothetical protein
VDRIGDGRIAKEVTFSAQRMNQSRSMSIQFPPKFHDMHFQSVREAIEAVIPDLIVDSGSC